MLTEPKQSDILSSWKSCVQRLLCGCVGLEALHQRASGRDGSGLRPLVRDDVYSPGTRDVFLAGLAVRPRDGVSHQC